MNYFEQALAKYLGADNLQKVQQVSVGIAGAGGLGSNCAMMLARTGFRRFKIFDFDVVEWSNLNRQFYFSEQVGAFKVTELKKNLLAINPDIMVEAFTERIEHDTVGQLFADCDIVIEAFDRPEYKKLLVETYMHTAGFLVSASGLAGWGDSDRIKVHKIKENFYLVGDLVSGVGEDCPPLAPCVAIAAAKQADLVISHVLGSRS